MRRARRPDGSLTVAIQNDDAWRAVVAVFVSLAWIVPFRYVHGYAGLPDYVSYYQTFDAMSAAGGFPPFQLDFLSSVHFWLQLQLSSTVEQALANAYNTNSAFICTATVLLVVRNKLSLPFLVLFAGLFTTQMHVSLLRAAPAYFICFFAIDGFLRTGKINVPLMLLAIGFHSSAAIALLAMIAARTRLFHNTVFLALVLAGIGGLMLTGLGQSIAGSAILTLSGLVPGFSKYLYYIFEPNSTSLMDLLFRSLVLGIGAWIAIFRRDYPTHFRVFLGLTMIAFLGLSFSPNIANRAIVYGVGFAILAYRPSNNLSMLVTSIAAIIVGITSFVFRWYWFADNQLIW